MKKLFAFILSFLYLGIATGFSTYSHYCMERYVETTLWAKDMSKCGVCGMSKTKSSSKKSCCKEEYKQVKLDKEHQAAEQLSKQFQTFATVLFFPTPATMPAPALINVLEALPVSHAPPNKEYSSIYVLNCIYRI